MKLKTLFITIFLAEAAFASPQNITEFIKIDQFGYHPNYQKIAVISDPQTGYNSSLSFTPGTVYQVRDWNTDAVVLTDVPTAWNSGATHDQSGDKVSWFDFSEVAIDGSYYIFDVENNVGSYRFEISECVYNDVLKTAMRAFYYQRCGFAKELPFADVGFTDGASHLGPQQDTDCRLYNDLSAGTSKDLHGGWYDAGDYNKYVNFTWAAMTDLLLAYEENQEVWSDDYNIPESGNGIPDILDEVKYELEWLLRMQNPDGSVLSVVGGGTASPPSADNDPRRYGPATTSATFTAAGIFALAAKQFHNIGQEDFALTLYLAANNAWTWGNANPGATFYNSGLVASGEQEVDEYGTFVRKIAAAVYLFEITGSDEYRSFIDENYDEVHLVQWGFAYPFEAAEQDMLLYHRKNFSATTSVRNAISNAFSASMSTNNEDNLPSFLNQTDAYMAYMKDDNYTWGSHTTKARQANMFLAMSMYGLDNSNGANYLKAAAGFLHYFHGVNPNAKAFLTNMAAHGAENSVKSVYHAWFHDGSPLWDEVGISTYGPAPGYLPGGVNPTYDWDGCCPGGCGSPENNALCNSESIAPPKGQPIQKSWKDFNTSWPLNSWTVTEPGIYTQAAYVRMLSKFASEPCITVTGIDSPSSGSSLIGAVYPQPAGESLTVRFNGNPGSISYRILDISGKEIKKISTKPVNGNSLLIELSAELSGLYFLEISDGVRSEMRRIVVN